MEGHDVGDDALVYWSLDSLHLPLLLQQLRPGFSGCDSSSPDLDRQCYLVAGSLSNFQRHKDCLTILNDQRQATHLFLCPGFFFCPSIWHLPFKKPAVLLHPTGHASFRSSPI